MKYKHGAFLGLVGGAIVMVGSILPWASVASGFGQVDFVGTSGDGVITLGIGVLIMLVGFAILGGGFRDAPFAALVLIILGVGVLGIAGQVLQGLIGKLTNEDAVRSSIGAGLYLVLVGGVVTILGGVVALRLGGRQEAPRTAPRPPVIGLADELTKLVALRDVGTITEEEFARQRAILLPPQVPTGQAPEPPPVRTIEMPIVPGGVGPPPLTPELRKAYSIDDPSSERREP